MSAPEDVEAMLAEHEFSGGRVCSCGEGGFMSPAQHRAHVAAVLAAYVVEKQREAVEGAADWLDDHTSCDCEDGDHLTRLASARTLKRYAATTYPTPKETP